MSNITGNASARTIVQLLVIAAGSAALSWEVVWQIKASLALGVSAWGTALTLAVTMGGMSIGALAMGHWLRNRVIARSVRLYGVIEFAIGIAGLCIGLAFQIVENLDSLAYAGTPGSLPLVHMLGIAAVIGVPTICMGATLPVFGLIGRQFQTSIATLYGLNTLGAAAGVLLVAFVLLPNLGITHTTWVIAAINFAVAFMAWRLAPGVAVAPETVQKASVQPQMNLGLEHMVVFVTGFATFALEVAWFRSLTAAFMSTTAAFAVMLSALLLALGIAARLVPLLKNRKIPLGSLVAWSGILIFVATPIIERFDIITAGTQQVVIFNWFMMTLVIIGPPVALLGMALPWILDEQTSPRRWSRLYALNTLAAIVGTLGAAWVLLPTIGFARTAWVAGALVTAVGVLIAPRPKNMVWGAVAVAALFFAVTFESGAGRTRTQGWLMYSNNKPKKILEFMEGPEATISAIEYDNGVRALIIDGFIATAQVDLAHYMPWMGHLPMLLHPNPQNALVICFGTGQTANAVRKENATALDIVDINPRVPMLAHNFELNEGVLQDPRVKLTIMDGRAFMRRTTTTYDVITLEPMPPNFAGVNALYSKEFYERARSKLGPQGVIAQWLPFHLLEIRYMASVVKTFMEVFPNALLWIDPVSKTGIIVGSMDKSQPVGTTWPGFARPGIKRDLSEQEVRKAVLLDHESLKRYAAYGDVITDDNQILAYGRAVDAIYNSEDQKKQNLELLKKLHQSAP